MCLGLASEREQGNVGRDGWAWEIPRHHFTCRFEWRRVHRRERDLDGSHACAASRTLRTGWFALAEIRALKFHVPLRDAKEFDSDDRGLRRRTGSGRTGL